MPEFNSCIYEGQVIHQRSQPKQHSFNYRVFTLSLDLDELEQLNHLSWFSTNGFNLFSFHEKDHGDGTGQGTLKNWVQSLLARSSLPQASSVRLLCYPRIAGYGFNPLSVYFCYNTHQQVFAILYEVTNTFGQRHTYVMPACEQNMAHSTDKLMYVSPFMPMESRYHFSIQPPEKAVSVAITQTDNQQLKTFFAAFSGKARPLKSNGFISLFYRYPLMTVKVICAIHWQAWKLWRKGMNLQPRPEKKQASYSWPDKNGVVRCENI